METHLKVKVILNGLTINGKTFMSGDTLEISDNALIESLRLSKFIDDFDDKKHKQVKVEKASEFN